MPITPEQCRAARGLLGWSQADLATNSNVSRPTVADFETKTRTPIRNNIKAMHDSLFSAGVDFIAEEETGGVGVRFREQKLEYVRTISIDRTRCVASIPMRFAGDDFRCLVSFEALEDRERTALSSDKEYADALSKNLHSVLAVVEPLAKHHAPLGEIIVRSDMLNS